MSFLQWYINKSSYQKYFLKCQKNLEDLTLPEDPNGDIYYNLCTEEAKISASFDRDFLEECYIFLAFFAIFLFAVSVLKTFAQWEVGILLLNVAIGGSLILTWVEKMLHKLVAAKRLAAVRTLLKALEERDHPNPNVRIIALTDLVDGRFMNVMIDSIGEVPRM